LKDQINQSKKEKKTSNLSTSKVKRRAKIRMEATEFAGSTQNPKKISGHQINQSERNCINCKGNFFFA
jgi:hypothetical protein